MAEASGGRSDALALNSDSFAPARRSTAAGAARSARFAHRDTVAISPTWRRVRFAALLVYGSVIATVSVLSGVPTGRIPLAVIIVTGLIIIRLGRGLRAVRQILVDWLPFTAVLLMYDGSRALVGRIGMPVHAADVARAETWLFGGVEPTVWLQRHLYDAAHPLTVHWYDAACTIVYTSHFLATPILAAVLWVRNRDEWLRFITRVIVLSLAGLATYILFPEAPPWLAAKEGVIPPVERLSARGWLYLHLGNVKTLLENAQSGGSNPVAAMPSLHIAFATLIALFLAARIRSRLRYLLVLYPLAMGFTLVYCGEHYVLDLIAGVIYAVAVNRAIGWWERRRATRSEHPAERVGTPSRGRTRDLLRGVARRVSAPALLPDDPGDPSDDRTPART